MKEQYSLEAYMHMPQRLEIIQDAEEDGYTAVFPELPGCITCTETLMDVLKLAVDAKHVWLGSMLERGMEISEPSHDSAGMV